MQGDAKGTILSIAWFTAAAVAPYNDQFSNKEIAKHVNFWPDARRHPVSGSTRIGNSPVSLSPPLYLDVEPAMQSVKSVAATFEARHPPKEVGHLQLLCFE